MTTHGAFAQIGQILLLREFLVVLDGDEIALAAMLSTWLFWVGLGALVGGMVGARWRPARTLAGAAALAGLSLPAAIVSLRLARLLFGMPAGVPLPMAHAGLLAVVAPALPGLSIGLMFPSLVPSAGVKPATAYGCEAAGALVGGVLFLFVFVSRMSPVTMAASAGVAAVLSAAWLARYGAVSGTRRRFRLAVPAGLLFAAALLGGRIDRWSEARRWNGLLPGFAFLETMESPYGRYAVLRKESQYSLFIDGHVLWDVPEPSAGVATVHTALLQHSAPRSVLLIARDPAAAVREARRHGAERLDCVVMDLRPLELLRSHVSPSSWAGLDYPDVEVLNMDPIECLEQPARSYDVILVDMPDPTTLGANRLYCREFFRKAAGRLNPGGVLAVAIPGQENYLGAPWLARNALIHIALRSVVPSVLVSPGDTCLMIARSDAGRRLRSRGIWDTSFDVDVLGERMAERGLDLPVYAAFLANDPYPPEAVVRVNQELSEWAGDWGALGTRTPEEGAATAASDQARPGKKPINDFVHPLAHWATRVLTVSLHEPEVLPALEALPWLAVVGMWTLVFIGAAVGVLVCIVARRHGPTTRGAKVALVVATAAMGFAVMCEQMVVLLWYQCRVGQVYVDLAALTALFMAGLALGSLSAARIGSPRRVLLAAQAALVVLGLALAAELPGWRLAPYFVALSLSGVLGCALGAHFSCCAEVWSAFDQEQTGPAGWLYAADLAGALTATLVVVAVIIPTQGHVAAALGGAAYAGLSFLVTILALAYLIDRRGGPILAATNAGLVA